MSYIKPQKIVKVVRLKRRNVYSRVDSRYYSLDIFPNEIFKPSVLKKKISTHYNVDETWDPEQNLIEFDNNPVSGFALTKIAGAGNQLDLKIKDPRGFNVSITSANLTEISLNSTLSHGVICTKCVWLFDEKSSAPYLALEGTQIYEQAMERARQLTTTITKDDLSSIKTGDCVLLRNGKSAYVIVGNDFQLLQRQFDFSESTENTYSFFDLDKRRYLYVIDKEKTDEFLKNSASSQYTDPYWHYNHYLHNYCVPQLTRITQSQIVENQSDGIRNHPHLNRILNLCIADTGYSGRLTQTSKAQTLRLIGENLKIELVPVLQHLEEIQTLYQNYSKSKSGSKSYYHNNYEDRYLCSLSVAFGQKIFIPRICTGTTIHNNTDNIGVHKICVNISNNVIPATFQTRSRLLNFSISDNRLLLSNPVDSQDDVDLFNSEVVEWGDRTWGHTSRRSNRYTGVFLPEHISDLKFIKATHEINGETFDFYL